VESAARELDEIEARLSSATQVENIERELDSFVTHYAALLEHGTVVGLQKGHCPLCDASRSAGEFNAAVAKARAMLAERGERAASVAASVRDARFNRDAAAARLSSEARKAFAG
jgi:chromosome segregation protein